MGPHRAIHELELRSLEGGPGARGVQERDLPVDQLGVERVVLGEAGEPLGARTIDPCPEEGLQELRRLGFDDAGVRLRDRLDHLPAGHHPDPGGVLAVELGHADLHRLVPQLVDRRRAPGAFRVGRVQGVRQARRAPDVHDLTGAETIGMGEGLVPEVFLPAELLLEEPGEDLRVTRRPLPPGWCCAI